MEGYNPCEGTRTQLVKACETIKYNFVNGGNEKKEKLKEQKKRDKFVKKESMNYYCSMHGKNATHSTQNCYYLKYTHRQSRQKNLHPSRRA